jgi:hypothetical protein
LSLRVVSLEDKIAAVSREIDEARRMDRPPGSAAQMHYDVLKAICADLRGRRELPRSNTLGELGRLLKKMKDGPRVQEGRHYEPNLMIAVANFVAGRWPTISQALERFGEESVE